MNGVTLFSRKDAKNAKLYWGWHQQVKIREVFFAVFAAWREKISSTAILFFTKTIWRASENEKSSQNTAQRIHFRPLDRLQ